MFLVAVCSESMVGARKKAKVRTRCDEMFFRCTRLSNYFVKICAKSKDGADGEKNLESILRTGRLKCECFW